MQIDRGVVYDIHDACDIVTALEECHALGLAVVMLGSGYWLVTDEFSWNQPMRRNRQLILEDKTMMFDTLPEALAAFKEL